MENKKNIILEVKGLKKYFPIEKDIFGKVKKSLRAVDDVTFTLEAGKTIGVVGESGCGKTTLGRTILQLYETTGGKSLYYGHLVGDFLPRYYKKGIGEVHKNARKYKSLILKLNRLIENYNQLCDEKEKINDNLILSLKEYSDLLDKIDDEFNLSDDVQKIKALKKVEKLISKIVILLEEASCLTGSDLLDSDCLKELSEDIKVSNLYNELNGKKEDGLDLAKLTKKEMRKLRTEIQLIFQDPYSSLPPRMTIGSILTEPVKVHKTVEKEKINEHVRKVMKMCGLQPQYYDRYPHEFSGGQRQRICIARALSVNPKLVICDEPVSALDVSIQAQIINLLKELQNNLGLTYMFISHDLSVVKYITDSILVMYLGNMMEMGDTNDIFDNPLHPYTQALFSAVPVPDPDAKMNRIILKGDIPSPANPPKGCKFHTRCEKCMSVCKLKTPKFIKYSENHTVACHLYDEDIMGNLAKYDNDLIIYEQKEQERLALKQEKKEKALVNKIKNVFKKKDEKK